MKIISEMLTSPHETLKTMKKILFFTAAIAGLIITQSCQKPEEDLNSDSSQDNGQEQSYNQKSNNGQPDGATQLGPQLDNPYTVANMQLAKANLVNQGVPSAKNIKVRTTHKYIRFDPKNKDEFDKISELGLILFDIPLDREIIKSGTYYHDSSLPDSVPTPQYTVVDVNFTYGGKVSWRVLENAYIPEDDTQFQNDSVLVNELVVEAFQLTGNGKDLSVSKGFLPSKWRPKGNITVWDDVLNRQTPVKNCYVHTQRFLKIGWGLTDANGDYTCDTEY